MRNDRLLIIDVPFWECFDAIAMRRSGPDRSFARHAISKRKPPICGQSAIDQIALIEGCPLNASFAAVTDSGLAPEFWFDALWDAIKVRISIRTKRA
jgi:hypothetical protein